MSLYNWQQPDWPHFRYDLTSVQTHLLSISEKMGLINGKISHFNSQLQMETIINLMVEEAVKTSEIEGDFISRPDIRSSIRNKLGLNPSLIHIHDKRANGIAELMLTTRDTFDQPLDEATLFNWHSILFSGYDKTAINIGYWRTHEEPMQIISGPYGKWTIHFEAPPSKQIPKEMKVFLDWFNNTAPEMPDAIIYPPVRAAIAHLYFESIHPFEDGNGRIGRAIAEKALSQGFGYPVLISLSQILESEKKSYYSTLQTASRSNEITPWINYFIHVILTAQKHVETQINFSLKSTAFFDAIADTLNDRQLKVIRRMINAGPAGFEGGMSAKKYMAITGASKATATRDLQQLVTKNILRLSGSGRSARYELNLSFL